MDPLNRAAAGAAPSSSLPSAESPAPVVPRPPRVARWSSLLVLLGLVAFFAPVYARHVRLSADPGVFNDDARQQVWPLLRYYDDRLFPTDAIADYYLACLPAGYRWLYAGLAQAADPRAVSKWLPYVLLAVTVWCAARAARRLRGPAAGWA
ncbi:MAG: putative rane protein, partial [Phycisphaerales bacterium]|nr:putative rane protein [Phycisphaerales bacterium]